MIPFITNFKQNSQILMKENLKIILCDACNISMREKGVLIFGVET